MLELLASLGCERESANDGDRALGVLEHGLRDRPEDEGTQSPSSTCPHHEEVGLAAGLGELFRGGALDVFHVHRNVAGSLVRRRLR